LSKQQEEGKKGGSDSSGELGRKGIWSRGSKFFKFSAITNGNQKGGILTAKLMDGEGGEKEKKEGASVPSTSYTEKQGARSSKTTGGGWKGKTKKIDEKREKKGRTKHQKQMGW